MLFNSDRLQFFNTLNVYFLGSAFGVDNVKILHYTQKHSVLV